MEHTVFDSYLVNGNITFFCGPHTDSFKTDILASSLLAELIAGQQSSNRVVSWSTYTDTVKKVGWILNSRSTQRIEFKKNSLFDVVDQSAGNALSQNDRAALANALSQLAAFPDSSPVCKKIVEKLQENANGTTTSTAALLTIIRTDKTVVTLQVTFQTADTIGMDILNQSVLNAIPDNKTNTWLTCSSLDTRQYNDVRSEVLKKLGRKIETEILHIQNPQQ
jgi:hypothetical protein